ncbi:hypothetical protein ACS0TY_012276 [Phlomoides rotata]
MADAILSAVAERLIGLMEEQARHHINLVRGAEEKLHGLAVDLQTIRIVLDDAENRRFKDKKINYWLSRLEQAAYEMEDVLDEWDYALLKSQMEEHRSKAIVAAPKQMVCSFLPSSSCLCFKKVAFKHNIGKKILGVKAKLDDILNERDQYELLPKLCDCLVHLRVLSIYDCESIPQGMESLIHLRCLVLNGITKLSREDLKAIFQLYHLQTLSLSSCNIEEIPKEIGNLIHLRFLDLSWNELLKELPMEIGNLIQLRHLDLKWNASLKELPECICDLQELQTLDNEGCESLCRIPETLVPILREFPGGIGGNKMELLKNMKHVDGKLRLMMKLDDDGDLNEVVEDSRRADLRNEINITDFELSFNDKMGELSWVWMDVMDALEPHPNLNTLTIWCYGGSKLPRWMVSPLNQLRNLSLFNCEHLTSLPAFGKLPCLEDISLLDMKALEIVGRDFLGITRGGGGCDTIIAFPKLKKLNLRCCSNWKEWEDITVEEEECAASSIMPCLTQLTVYSCDGLRMLPHRLLRKVSSLKTVDISYSTELKQRYGDKDGSDWKSISVNNAALHLIIE